MENIKLKSYIIGFLASIALTLLPYYFISQHVLSPHGVYTNQFIISTILSCAVVQTAVQLVFFLNLGKEPKPRWKLAVFISFISIILIIGIGSIWIMQHLNYNMSMLQLDNLMKYGEGF